MRRPITVLLLALVPHSASPQSTRPDLGDRLDEWIRPLVVTRDLAGTVLVRHQGKDVIRRAYGESSTDLGTKNRLETRFAVGSISKQFTAATLLRLRDQGRLDLEDSVSDFLAVPATARAITLRDLLAHRSGLIRDVPSSVDSGDLETVCLDLLSTPLSFEPGSRTAYSNAGYVVLTCIVEEVTGERFEDHVRRELFERLGLSRTDFWDGSQALPGQAQGYDPGGPTGELRRTPIDHKRRHLGAGGIVSTVGDLVRWAESLTTGMVLSAPSTREMLADAGDGRGFGVGVYRRKDRRVVGHDGVTHGYTAFLEWYPDDDLIVAYAGNIRTSAFELLEDALPALVFGDEPGAIERPERLRFSRDASLVGSYRVHDALVLDIEMRPTGLELRGTGGYFTPLLQIDQDRYWYRAMYARIELRRDASGAVTGMLWQTVQGQSFEIPRSDG